MERDANYVAVGAFILLVIAMGIGFVLWYTDANDGRKYGLYEIYFDGSVSGLDRGSPVRYLGVDVGRVRKISIDKSSPTLVAVVAEIDQEAPISAATRASLGLQGVTGLLFINLKETTVANKTAALRQGVRYPVIEATPSEFDAFLQSVPELMSRATTLLKRIELLFSDQNLAGLAATVESLHAATAGLPETSRNVAQLVNELQATVVEIRSTAANFNAISNDAKPEIHTALERMNTIAENLTQASARIDQFTQRSATQLGNFTEQGLFELERLVRETRSAAREFRDLSHDLQENPSRILYEPPESGVEIAK
jgi:phospholipid/cholesterol/gamma-HCH transport system substrate-binding protein